MQASPERYQRRRWALAYAPLRSPESAEFVEKASHISGRSRASTRRRRR
jgi:hypothetical protein